MEKGKRLFLKDLLDMHEEKVIFVYEGEEEVGLVHYGKFTDKEGSVLGYNNVISIEFIESFGFWGDYEDDDCIEVYELIENENVMEGKGMERLKIELFRYENLVFGKVLDMDEKLRGTEMLAGNNEFYISSCIYPELDEGHLYVRGENEHNDNNIFYYTFDSVSEAENVCENIKKLIDEINSKPKEEKLSSQVIQVL